jgi:YbgC/YbaW family acyl-CoA thioester hydrolase
MLYSDRFLVTMADVDAAGIIYYASPLRWAEKLFTHWIHDLGHPHRQMFSEGIATPAVHVSVDYRDHLSLDDMVSLQLTAAHLGTSSFTLRLEAFLDRPDISPVKGAAAVEVRTTHVYTQYRHPSYGQNAQTVTQPMPSWLRTALEVGYRA